MPKRPATPTVVELVFETGRDAREFRRLLSVFDGRAGVPLSAGDYHGYVLPDIPERTPHFEDSLRACSGRVLRQMSAAPSRSATRNPEDDDTTLVVTPFDPPAPYRVVILTVHQSGPKETIVECDYMEQAVEVADRERGRQTNQRNNAIVRLDAAKGGTYKPRVQWTFRGEWKREMQ